MTRETSGHRIFPRRLRAAREERGLSQVELADQAGLQQSALSHYESGARRPSFTNLRRLSRALDVSTDYLIGNSSSRAPVAASSDKLVRDVLSLSLADRKVVRTLVDSLRTRHRSAS